MVIHAIKMIAFGLIVFPEPVTTVLGILVLSATFALTRQKSLNKFGNLEELIKKSRRIEEPCGFLSYLIAKPPVVHHVINQDSLLSSRRADRQPEILPVASSHKAWFDNRRLPDKVVFHALKTSLPQYESAAEVWQKSHCGTFVMNNSGSVVACHKLKLCPFYAPEETYSGRQPKTVKQKAICAVAS